MFRAHDGLLGGSRIQPSDPWLENPHDLTFSYLSTMNVQLSRNQNYTIDKNNEYIEREFNELPKLDETTDAMDRRLMVIEFTSKFLNHAQYEAFSVPVV